MAKGTCSIDGCTSPARKKGWCYKHYSRWYKHGDPLTVVRREWPHSLVGHLEPQPNGCIYFTGCVTPDGYGHVWRKGVRKPAHRAAYEMWVGPIPEGLVIDHTCHNLDLTCPGGSACMHRRCVNPDHLAPKTHRGNILASPHSRAAVNAAKTHCIRGHEFSPENTYRDPRGDRVCKACRRVRYHLNRSIDVTA